MAQFTKLKIKGVGEWEVGGGGSGGTTNYNNLTNKPKINNVELMGNKTPSQLGLAVPGDIPTKLPNPATLTFTGYEAVDYDGSEAVQVEIPEALPTPYTLSFTGASTAQFDGTADVTVNIPQGGGGGESLEWEYIGESTNENVLTFQSGKYKAFYATYYINNRTTGANVYVYPKIDGHIYNRWTSVTGTNKSFAGFGFYLPYMSLVYAVGKTTDYTGYLTSTSRGGAQAHLADIDSASAGKAMMECSTPANINNWSMKLYGLK